MSNLRNYIWTPSLKKAKVRVREMKPTRHSFATNALSFRESPLWIAKVLGHCNSEMVIKVYSKFIEDAKGARDGDSMTNTYRELQSNKEEAWGRSFLAKFW